MSNYLVKMSKLAQEKLINKSTHAERKFKEYLSTYSPNISYEFQKIIYIYDSEGCMTHYYIVDFYFDDYKMIIELDGSFHDDDEQTEKDIEREDILIDLGYHILRIDNVLVYNSKALYNKIKNFIKDNNIKPNLAT